MKPHVTVITLGVTDLQRSLAFYRDGLGLPTEGIIGEEYDHGAVVFFDLAGGLKLALWARADIARDTGLDAAGTDPVGVTMGHNVASRSHVDEVMAEAAQAGARIVKTARDTFYGGYAGYFADPDGHLWEVVWNPALLPDD